MSLLNARGPEFDPNIIHVLKLRFFSIYADSRIVSYLQKNGHKAQMNCPRDMCHGTWGSDKSLVMRKPAFCICKNKEADQLRGNRGFAVTAKLISAFVFATRIVQSLY